MTNDQVAERIGWRTRTSQVIPHTREVRGELWADGQVHRYDAMAPNRVPEFAVERLRRKMTAMLVRSYHEHRGLPRIEEGEPGSTLYVSAEQYQAMKLAMSRDPLASMHQPRPIHPVLLALQALARFGLRSEDWRLPLRVVVAP